MDVNINVKIQKDHIFVHVMLDFDWIKTKENAMVSKNYFLLFFIVFETF